MNKKLIEAINHPSYCAPISNLYAKLTIKDGLTSFKLSGWDNKGDKTGGIILTRHGGGTENLGQELHDFD